MPIEAPKNVKEDSDGGAKWIPKNMCLQPGKEIQFSKV